MVNGTISIERPGQVDADGETAAATSVATNVAALVYPATTDDTDRHGHTVQLIAIVANDTPAAAGDEILHNGTRFRLVGAPEPWTHPTGWEAGTVLALHRAAG